jgi:hypothetical protein
MAETRAHCRLIAAARDGRVPRIPPGLRGQRAQRVGVLKVLQVVEVPGQVIAAGERDDCAGEQAGWVETAGAAEVPPFASHGRVNAVVSYESRLCRCGVTGRLCGAIQGQLDVDSMSKKGR